MRNHLLSYLVLISAIINISAEYLEIPGLIYTSKPLTTLLILFIALNKEQAISQRYKTLVLFGLGFSLLGDVLLMVPYDLFIFGLASFLVAQIFYLIAFREGVPFNVRWLQSIVVIVYGATTFWFLSPVLMGLRIPVLVYLVVILAMVWQAWHRHLSLRSRSTLLAGIGAGAFVLSDTFLAFHKFRVEFLTSTALVLSTYYFAQWCISQSVSGSHLSRVEGELENQGGAP